LRAATNLVPLRASAPRPNAPGPSVLEDRAPQRGDQEHRHAEVTVPDHVEEAHGLTATLS
jgi:hypothetical protein